MGGQLWNNRGVVGNALNRYGVRSMRPLFSSGVLREGVEQSLRMYWDHTLSQVMKRIGITIMDFWMYFDFVYGILET